jgi:hypothetical protein
MAANLSFSITIRKLGSTNPQPMGAFDISVSSSVNFSITKRLVGR